MGFEHVQAFRASGNVVFTGPRKAEAKLVREIEKALVDALGYDVAVFLRSPAQMRALAEFEPFDPELVAASAGKLQVALLGEAPSAEVRKKVLALATDEDRLTFGERELYWLPSGGIADSALDMKTIGKAVGVNTMRTQGTIEQIAAKWFTEAR
jgi:uncharacterized protein (DUF1697 family)